MFLLFSPFSYLFFSLYFLILVSITIVSDLVYFWLLMELMMLLFMGISFTVFTSNVSSLITYFFIQSLSSFLILIAYFWVSPVLFTLSIFLKLGIFPFVYWYVSALQFFPASIFFLASSFQNLPPLFLLLNTSVELDIPLFLYSSVLSLLVSGVLIISSQSLRLLLVVSSIGSNVWLLLGVYSNFMALALFFVSYFVLLLLVLSSVKSMIEVLIVKDSNFTSLPLMALISLSGLPPSPLFVGNAFIILSVLSDSENFLFLLILLLSSVCASGGYVCFSMVHYLNLFRI